MLLVFILVLTHTKEGQGKEESVVNERARGFQHANIGSVPALILGLVLPSPRMLQPLSLDNYKVLNKNLGPNMQHSNE